MIRLRRLSFYRTHRVFITFVWIILDKENGSGIEETNLTIVLSPFPSSLLFFILY